MSITPSPSAFIDDAEKMWDFLHMSMEEFLSSYSYLTREDYRLTVLRIASYLPCDMHLPVDIFMDTVTDYTDDMQAALYRAGYDNIITMWVPRTYLVEWYDSISPVLPYACDSFDEWYAIHYTCEDTDGLYAFLKRQGYNPEIPMPSTYTVEFTDSYEVHAMSRDEAVKAAQDMRAHDNGSIYVDGKLWS